VLIGLQSGQHDGEIPVSPVPLGRRLFLVEGDARSKSSRESRSI
jgi:hypothetical protein